MTMGAAVCALNVAALYGASVLPAGKLGALFLSAVFVAALSCEGEWKAAWASFGASAVLSLLLVPAKSVSLAYCLFLGWYGIAKEWLERRCMGLKLLGCKLGLFALGLGAVLILMRLLGLEAAFEPLKALLGGLSDGGFYGLLAAVSLPLFLLADWLYGQLVAFYYRRLRPLIRR
jgi:hypothetical protein